MEMKEWCESIPKVELHAHLNGSVRNSTLLELAKDLGEKGIIVFSDFEHVILKNDRSLTEVFKLFDLIHIVTTDHSTVNRITKEVVEDFAAENVVYLELRTTPKRNESKGMTKRSYMEAVIAGLRRVCTVDIDCASTDVDSKKETSSCLDSSSKTSNGLLRKKIYVRLLLSIDRRETLDAAMETVKLAIEMRGGGVVGIDLSGNPRVGDWKTFLPALVFAREQGLRVTLHCGEVPNQEEIHAMLDFHPERIGHACCLEDDAWKRLKSMKIPVEICLTSNIRTNTISSVDVHHFAELYRLKHPLTLCTDDSGVFSTSLSEEYAIAANAFNLGKTELFQLARNAVDFSFADERVVGQLKELFDVVEDKLLH
ncbi:hypothetical protein vseg_017396 [Gypsophila vaccaria]